MGVLVIIALVPKKVWIGLAVITALAAMWWLWAQWRTKHKREHRPTPTPPANEPTLAEIIEKSRAAGPVMQPPRTRTFPSQHPAAGDKPSPVATQAVPRSRPAQDDCLRSIVPSSEQAPGLAEVSESRPDPSASMPQPAIRTSNLGEAKAAIEERSRMRLQENESVLPLGQFEVTVELSDASATVAHPIRNAWTGNLADAKRAIDERLASFRTAGVPARTERPVRVQNQKYPAELSEPSGVPVTPVVIDNEIAGESGKPPSPITVGADELTEAIDLPRVRTVVIDAGIRPEISSPLPPPLHAQLASASGGHGLVQVVVPADKPAKEYSVPLPPEGWDRTRWLGPGETIEIAGVAIAGGLFYTGIRLDSPGGEQEPSLVNSVLAVARYGDYKGDWGYWRSYTDLEPAERRAYLNWLASDRADPACAISYVRLFLFGLERRVLMDSAADPSTKHDWPAITEALQRLSSIYGSVSSTVQTHAAALLNWMALDECGDQLYKKPLPTLERTYELPFYLRLALGQCSLDRAPIPAPLALAWIRLSPEIFLRTPAIRCVEEFDQLFALRYQELYGLGMVLPKNRTKLKFGYRPLSPALQHSDQFFRTFGDVPDVTALRTPMKGLQELVLRCTDELNAFSRLVGRSPESRDNLDGLLLLPTSIWPSAVQAALTQLRLDAEAGNICLTMSDLTGRFGGAEASIGKEKAKALARALEAARLGIEPNLLEGARIPADNDPIVLFALLPDQTHGTDSATYQTAQLTLQLASTVAQADGAFSEDEVQHLILEIQSWSHLSLGDRARLRAHLDLLVAAPLSLTAMRKKLDALDEAAKEAVALSMVALAQVDGSVSPEEIRFLERVYKALGVDPTRVVSDIHAADGRGSRPRPTQSTSIGLQLDPERIAALQRDTAQVSALLANIFVEEPIEVIEPTPVETETDTTEAAGQLLGLDETHSALLRLMLSRPTWNRSDLEDSATDLQLMLDGALEQINEASFDAYDIPFTDGDDPLEINPEFFEKIEL